MSFKDILFPECISLHAIGGPGFLTHVVPQNSGKESRDQVWQLERGSWEVSHAARLPADYKPLQAFFRSVRGRAYSFRFKDHTDFEVTVADGLFVQITSTTFQMVKRYTFDGETYDRTITKPRDAVTTTGGTLASIDYATGIATMTSGTPTAWAGEFDCHVRFDTDQMRAETIDRSKKGLIVGWSSIPLLEVKE